MGYESKVQVIQRGNKTRQFYLICPAPLAEAMELQKGERIEWVVVDRRTLEVRRLEAPARRPARRGDHA
jgi:bifunctional DNA-binding transcriptional regulator/antitoxin component of YhaV-PrlF toxin-antitoxin module